MKRCLICDGGEAAPLLDFGPQALCNRYLAGPNTPQKFFPLALGQCAHCGLIQLLAPVSPAELRPRFDWITYNEQEGHLDDLVDKACRLTRIHPDCVIGAISFKDDTTLARFQKRGFHQGWRIDPKADLEISDPAAGLETVQEALSPSRAATLAAKRGQAGILIVRHILEHAQDPCKFADALKSLVTPGGYVIFEVPDCQPALTRKDYSMPWEEHVAYYTPQTFRRSLASLGFREIQYSCYTYSNENSLVAIVQCGEPAVPQNAADDLAAQKSLGRNYAAAFPSYRESVRQTLARAREKSGKAAMFGAGHLSGFWINALGVAEHFEFVIDDHPKKAGLFMPGSGLPIRPSSSLIERGIKLCLLSLSPESEAKVVAKNQAFIERGGSFVSMFPGKPNSIA